MKKLDWRVKRKREILKRYHANLQGQKNIRFFEQDLESTTPWFIDVMVDRREALQIALKEKSIGSRVMYPPINKQAAYNIDGEHEVSNKVGMEGLWLPSETQLTDDQIDRICNAIKEFYEQ